MPTPPRSVKTRRTDDAPAKVAGTAFVARKQDKRQSGLFDVPLPSWIKPCLPTLVPMPPVGPKWSHEIKWDGYRVSAYVENGVVKIHTRNGYDWTTRFPTIAAGIAKLKVRSAVIDGEAVILDEQGRSNFSELQADLDRHGSRRAVLYAFDLLYLDGEDLRSRPLSERRAALGSVLTADSPILFSEEFDGTGAELFKMAHDASLEGIVSKRVDKPYRSGRRPEWLKTKCVLTDTFIIIGYQPGSGAIRTPIANIKVAALDGELRSVGAVGTGFSEAAATSLRAKFDRLKVGTCAVVGLKGSGAVWVKPELRAEVAYRGLTTAGELRHASFKGLVEDS